MKFRALILEDDPSLRLMMQRILEQRGYEVVTYRDPSLCPLYHGNVCCQACVDILITDNRMPNVTGLEFLESQHCKGCNIKNVAVMSGAWEDEEIDWLDECEAKVDPSRVLSDLVLIPVEEG